jgi:hypothetical protein
MRVAQDSGGRIRMVEADVPSDLLDLKIAHISFDVQGEMASAFNTPNMALQIILYTEEVREYKKTHNIGPFFDGFTISDITGPNSPHVSGSLNNVTVSQALDYILETFPGFWIYENCSTEDGGRKVVFAIFNR